MKQLYAKSVKRLAVDMSLSENPLGCSPAVLRYLKKARLESISKYPDIGWFVSNIAKIFGVDAKNVAVGNGSEQLIKLIVQSFVESGDKVAIQSGSFDVFSKESLLKTQKVELLEAERLIESTSECKLIFLCNPNNPTGEEIDTNVITNIIRNNPRSVVVLDEATGEFLNKNESFVQRSIKTKNLLVLKTVSKVFGGAGLRVGFVFGNKRLVKKLNEGQQAFPVSNLSAQLVIECLKDNEFVTKTIKFVDQERSLLKTELERLGFKVSNSVTNNLLVTTNGKANFTKLLEDKGVSVVDAGFFPGLNVGGFRIAIRDKETNRRFIKIVKDLRGGERYE